MTDYTLIKNSAGITLSIRRDDGASIPTDPANSDYQRFLEDTAGTTVPEQIIPEPQPDLTPSLNDRISALELAEIERELGL